ncbi:hypothetical protein LMG19145_00169 [Xanthomonas arboricola pv. fragariae]|nr:hypothetical protein LMG19145_00169 [Xanthomonas arboricola pv. fragariae]
MVTSADGGVWRAAHFPTAARRAIAAVRRSTMHRLPRAVSMPAPGRHRCDQRIGTNPAPKAVSIRTSSHFGPTLTSGKSPTAT